MFYTPTNELILKSNGTDLSGNPTEVEKWVSAQKKGDILRKLREKYLLIEKSNPDLPMPRICSPFIDNFFEEGLNHVPMWCNMLTQRGVKRVLFTGHLDIHRDDWIICDEHTTYNSGYSFIIPPELMDGDGVVPDSSWKCEAKIYKDGPEWRDYERRKVWPSPIASNDINPNILAFFIPIIAKEYGYELEVVVLEPPQERNKGVLYKLYEEHDIETIPSNQQYRHGLKDHKFRIEGDLTKHANYFDTVLFAGVPIHSLGDESSFTADQVIDSFKDYTTSQTGCKLIDMSDTHDKHLRFLMDDHEVHEVLHDSIEKMFHGRNRWNGQMNPDVNSLYYGFMERFLIIVNGVLVRD